MRLAALSFCLALPAAAEEFDRAALETCLGAVAGGASGSECLVPIREQCNSLLQGGTLARDIACLDRANAAIGGWSEDILTSVAGLGLTASQVIDYRRRLSGFCLGQMTVGDKVDEVGFGLCELAGHATLHRDILRRRAAAQGE